MAKLSLSQMSNPAFSKAMENLLTKSLPVKAAWQLKNLTTKFNEELKKFTELRKEIVERYATKDAEGKVITDNGNYSFEPAAADSLTKDMNDLLAIEVNFTALSINDLGNIELSTQQLFDLDGVIE